MSFLDETRDGVEPRGRWCDAQAAARFLFRIAAGRSTIGAPVIAGSHYPVSPSDHVSRDPLHGITLEAILNELLARHGWAEMAQRIPIRCFQFDPSIKSSLTFLRRTPWARQKVEAWFVAERLSPPA